MAGHQTHLTLSENEASAVAISALDRIVAAETVETVWTEQVAAMKFFGFHRLFYGFTRQYTVHGLGPRDEMLVLSNHDDAYLGEYLGKEMYLHGPMSTWARGSSGAMSWSWIEDNEEILTDRQRAVLEFNRSHGVIAGYTISFRDAIARNKGAIALTVSADASQCEADAIWEAYSSEINVLNQVSHLKYKSLPWPGKQVTLSPRQREVLEWVGDGKTMADIATIMGLTSATVEKHLKKAREALKVDTTAQAVMKASLYNQIFVVDPTRPEEIGR